MSSRVRQMTIVLVASLLFALAVGVSPALALQSDASTPDVVCGLVVSAVPRVVPGSGAIVTEIQVLDTLPGGGTELTSFTMAGGVVGDKGMWTERYAELTVGDSIIAGIAEEDGRPTAVQAPITADGLSPSVLTDPATIVNGIAAGYSWDGLHWPDGALPVSYRINSSGMPAGSTNAINAGAQTWENDPGSYMDFAYLGSTGSSPGYGDNANVIGIRSLGTGGRLAECTIWFTDSTKEIDEFDIAFNTPNYSFATDGSSSAYDMQALATHELGHTLHLSDLYDAENSSETMYGYASVGDTSARTLAAGDIAGIRAIYPLALPTSTLSGYVTSSGGGPLSGVSISVDGFAFGSTNASGYYSIAGIPQGTYGVTYSLSGYTPKSVTVDLTSNNTQSVTLSPVVILRATLSGYVRDTDGNPLSDASVNVGGIGIATTNASGFYSMSDIPQAVYSVTYSHSGYLAQTIPVNLTSDVTQSVTLVQSTPRYTLSGIVRDSAGSPLSGVSVNVGGIASGITGTNGAYSITGIAAGTYDVSYSRGGYVAYTTSVSISANRSLDATLATNTITFSGTLRDSSESTPLAGAVVRVGTVATGTTDAIGQFLILGVPPGVYAVTYSASGYTTQVASVNLTTSRSVAVLLEPLPVTWSGRVVDALGSPIRGVFVDAGGSGGFTLTDGWFSIAGIARGSRQVTYSHPDYLPRTDLVTFAGGPASAGDVTMTPIPTSVSLSAAAKTVKKGKTLKVSGTVGPRHMDGGTPVRIYKWRWVNKKWKSYSYSTALAADDGSSTRYSKSLKFSYTGKWRLRAKHVADERHPDSAQSGYVYITVK